jgi:urease accessory protein
MGRDWTTSRIGFSTNTSMPKVAGSIAADITSYCGRTQLSHHSQSYPLKIAKTFDLEGQLGVYMMDASPGMMAGDRYELTWSFGDHTRTLITNQSYTKVHPARASLEAVSRPCEQLQRLTLGEGAFVEYMPEPTMLYKDAILHSVASIEMEPGSHLLWSDLLCPGRTHRGEVFEYELYQNRCSVTYGGELIYSSRQRIRPAVEKLQAGGSWGAYTHQGTLCFFSEQADAALADQVREHVAAAYDERGTLYCGVSRTYRHGIVVSVLGQRVYEIQQVIEEIRSLIRSSVFDLAPLLVRK